MAVSKRLRYEILRRDNHTCRYCGGSAPDTPLRIDHVMPVALGGSDAADNLVTSCEPCNSGKSSASPDATHVADVSNAALHWADAMKQAAEELRAQTEPKRAYRDAFQQEWSQWTREVGWKTQHVDLPDGWKGSLDTFYEAALPQEVWRDIIEKAMTNPTVKADNTFRYACGIAWRMVRELQEAARAIVASSPTNPVSEPHLLDRAAVDVWATNWLSDHGEQAAESAQAEFEQSIADFRRSGEWISASRFIKAAQNGGCSRITTIQAAIAETVEDERAGIVIEWIDAWAELDGATQLSDTPDDFFAAVVMSHVNDLADHGVPLSRIKRAAILAAYHHSTELHEGLRPAEQAATSVDPARRRVVDLWARSYRESAGRWPTGDELAAVHSSLGRVQADGGFHASDLFGAASAAGAYQDADLTTCLTRLGSVFEAAARPLA